MLEKMRGIVLHTLKYNDTSVIVDMYTDLHGRRSFVAAVPRSRRAAVKTALFQPLSILELEADTHSRGALAKIKDARTHVAFGSIPFSPVKSAVAMFLAEFLYRAVREEDENGALFSYLLYSISWFDECSEHYANFHLVFLMRLSRFLGFFPNLENYAEGDIFDMQAATFTHLVPTTHHFYVNADEAVALRQLMRLNYETMGLFKMNRAQRTHTLAVIIDYYRLHLSEFPPLKSLDILKELFD